MIKEYANAKINLFLDVTSKREDGFHNIKSIMQSVSLCDTLFISATEADRTEINLSVDAFDIPTDSSNLICVSAKKYLEYFKKNAIVEITLEKRIPTGAGLGGGSADAAAVLRGLNRIFRYANEEQLLAIASDIGSDVPFCLVGGTAFCEGKGEVLTPIAFHGELHVVIAIGRERISTPEAYRSLDRYFNSRFIPDKRGDALICDMDSSVISCGNLYNVFEVVISLPEIDKIKEILAKSGAECTLMSGSGPAVFGIFQDKESASLAEETLINEGFTAFYANGVTV